jgi:hypothetical protein
MAIQKVDKARGQFFYQSGHGKVYFENLLIYENDFTGIRFFNLPAGNYKFQGNFIEGKQTKFLEYPLQLPRKDWDKFKQPTVLIDKRNPSPASIYLDTATIVVNEDFLKLPFYAQTFIIFHEVGHLFYDKEIDADIYAFYKCWENGIPITMSIKTHIRTLTTSNENKERILNALNVAQMLNEKIENICQEY